jgi:hypothetical protein
MTVSVEKPASGLFGVLQQRVSVDALVSADRVGEKSPLLYDFASDFPVAARGRLNPCDCIDGWSDRGESCERIRLLE